MGARRAERGDLEGLRRMVSPAELCVGGLRLGAPATSTGRMFLQMVTNEDVSRVGEE